MINYLHPTIEQLRMTNAAGLNAVAQHIIQALSNEQSVLNVQGPLVCSIEDGKVPHAVYDTFVNDWTSSLRGVLDECRVIAKNAEACASSMIENDHAAGAAEAP